MILAMGFVFSDALAPLSTLPSLRWASRMVAFLAAQFMAAGIRPLVLTRGYGDDEWRQACERIACPAALVVDCAHARHNGDGSGTLRVAGTRGRNDCA
jgi:hypothetical protein